MTKEQKKAEGEKLQKMIDEVKAEVYKGELDRLFYHSRIAGMLEAEVIGLLDYSIDTDLDLEKIQKVENVEEKHLVEACKICDNNCDYCRFNCNCSTLVEA